METVGYNWKQEKAAEKALEREQQKKVENVENSVIMDTRNGEGGAGVHYITKIDIAKYRCITEDISTDEVIITDERIRHIQERHPNDFERYERFIKDILENPDYILEANKPNTAFLLKTFIEDDEQFQLILRLAVLGAPDGYKNSIITFLKVEEKRYSRYLRTKNILYKAE